MTSHLKVNNFLVLSVIIRSYNNTYPKETQMTENITIRQLHVNDVDDFIPNKCFLLSITSLDVDALQVVGHLSKRD